MSRGRRAFCRRASEPAGKNHWLFRRARQRVAVR